MCVRVCVRERERERERERGRRVVALHLPIGPLKIRFVLEMVPRCEPNTYQPISRCHNHFEIMVYVRQHNVLTFLSASVRVHRYCCVLLLLWVLMMVMVVMVVRMR